ncbi:flagellar assembly peptidoglycan hydrolase FlgJ [Pseudomonas sp. NCCP-436]|uniref:flagellar assembly peptidoglycan hydrolase FlgJ n=1 Tax=Pseudomonas sp. NCCP-436 TaxID=2842481 RepID=UPI001C80CE0F|nr:flagellar assembly peptidoglycan hydrolase FlgJ [Pseudomonas sp. NCCP-436]GIZ13829.1 peptidoglycan hydrolase FlgJ [Pseudomonas sp. NCCP-436]
MDSRLSAGLLGTGISPLDSGAVTDLNRLNQFKVGGDTEQNIRKVAQEFESLFMNEMLKAMRSANAVFGEDNFLNSSESKTYQDMHDQQLAVTLSREGRGIGLADVLVRQMSKLKQGPSRPNPFAQIEQPAASDEPLVATDPLRDDAALLNRRRLAVPGKLTDRLLAGIVPTAAETSDKSLAGEDWIAARPRTEPALSSGSTDTFAGRRLAQPPLAPGKAAFSSPQEFVATMLPMAEAAASKIGVDPRYLVAQAALETGWGKSIIRTGDGGSSYNLFGIKTHQSWNGDSARVLTTEYRDGKPVREVAKFRAYDSYAQSFEDYVSFLQSNGRYQKALSATENPERFVQELQQAGYATDPNYARKISQIARKMQTYQAVAAADGATARI